MHGRFLGPLIALMLWQSCVWAAPFSAPSDRKRATNFPRNSVFRPNNIPQRPQKQEDHSRAVEFRGYFYLNGMPRFCIYNVDAQFSEWISLGEATFEEFNASDFNVESETLTVIYQNQSFNLNLYGPTSSPLSPPSPRSRRILSTPTPTVPGQPKRMPPVPKFVPQFPAPVTSVSPSTPSPQQITASGKRAPPPRPNSFPILPGPRVPGPLAGPSSTPTVSSNPSQPLSSSPLSAPTPTIIPTPSPGLTPTSTTNPNTGTGTEIDFSNLPPPPPPPNILPPSAPPNIEPSRETE